MNNITLSTMAELFLITHRPPFLAEGTGHYYRYILQNLLWYADREGWPSEAKKITSAHISSFLNYVATEKVRWGGRTSSCCHRASPATCHHYGRILKTFFSWAEQEGYIKASPLARVRLKQPRYREVEPFSDEEILSMLEVCENEFRRDRFVGSRNHAIVSIFADTGIRLSEQASLTLSDVHPQLERLRVMGKGEKERIVPLASEARRSLRRYLRYRHRNGRRELWLTDDGEPLERRGLEEVLVRLKKRAGIRGFGRAHRFRHYFATTMLNSGASLRQVQALLGHEGPEMTLRYAHKLDIQEAIAAHQRMSPLDRLRRRRRGWWDEDERW